MRIYPCSSAFKEFCVAEHDVTELGSVGRIWLGRLECHPPLPEPGIEAVVPPLAEIMAALLIALAEHRALVDFVCISVELQAHDSPHSAPAAGDASLRSSNFC